MCMQYIWLFTLVNFVHVMNHSFRFPPSLFKQILASYDLSTKDAIVWGVSNESVAKAKYCSYGDAVVEETDNMLHQYHFYMMIMFR